MRRLLTVMALALALPGTAAAGGIYASFDNRPADLQAGHVWTAQITVVSCYGLETRAKDLVPNVTIRNASTGERLTFRGVRTRHGWIARVRFPSGGRWTYAAGVVGFQTFEQRPVTVAAAPQGAALGFWSFGAALTLLFFGVPVFVRRCRSRA
jgi:hypothetical protein